MTLADAALRLARRGIPVFPLEPRGKTPITSHGFRDATTHEAQIRLWWATQPSANIGVPTGTNTFDVLDVDGEEGEASLRELVARYGPLPETAVTRTGRGRQLHYRGGFLGNTAGRLGPGLDTRGEGGYVVVPPSVHPNGRRYESIRRVPLADLPEPPSWLVEALRPAPPPSVLPRPAASSTRYGKAALERAASAVSGTPEGTRNDTLNREALGIGQLVAGGGLDEAEAVFSLLSAAMQTGLSESEARRTIASAFTAGAREPRRIPDRVVLVPADSVQNVEPIVPKERPWPVLAPEALYGLAGDVVRTIRPHTEADDVALLAQFLCAFGCAAGRNAYAIGDGDHHFGNLFVALVGATSKGRKGSSWGRVARLFEMVDEQWTRSRVKSGLVSGEGLIHNVRDGRGEDAGESDKRLLCHEAELANVLRVMERDGNTASPVIRLAWDKGDLGTLAKNHPETATGAHVGIVGHTTEEEVARYLDRTELANGFANRFLWFLVRRSKVLPEGSRVPDEALRRVADRLAGALTFSATVREVSRDEEARAIWNAVYPRLSEGVPGLTGTVLGRAEAQVLRLSLVYALLDEKPTVGRPHLEAALGVWDYAEASARHIFGSSLGDSVADGALAGLEEAGESGLDRTEIAAVLGRNVSAVRISRALNLLARLQLARGQREIRKGPGRRAERWFATTLTKHERNEEMSVEPVRSSIDSFSSYTPEALR